MPKIKTHRGAAARLKRTSTGKLKRRRAFASHNLEHKGASRKRDKRRVSDLSDADRRRARKMLGAA